MKKKVFRITIILVLALAFCVVPFLNIDTVAEASTLVATDETTMNIVFFSSNDKDDNGNLIPDSAGKITVGVAVTKKNDGISFTLTTRDKSAISEKGDYTSQSKDYKITTSATKGATQYFSVQTYQTDATNLVEGEKTYGTTRVFEIVLCNIVTDSGCDYVVKNDFNATEQGSQIFDCRVLTEYDYAFSKIEGKNGLYFDDYLYGNSFASIWIERGNVYYQTPTRYIAIYVDEDTTLNQTFSRFISNDYYIKYHKQDWADVYYGGSATISESGWCTVDTPAKLTISDSSGNEVFYSEYYDPKCSGVPILFGETGYAQNNNSEYRYNLTNAARSWLNNHKGYTVYNTQDPMYKHAYSYYSKQYFNFPSVTGKIYKNNSETFNLRIARDSSWDMVFAGLRIDSELYDNNAPTLKSTSFDEIASTDNKVLRFSVRFSEPVHFLTNDTAKNLTITGYANDSGKMPLDFKYVGGEGTDTLYFECNLKDYENKFDYTRTKITSIRFRNYDTFSSQFATGLYDYAYNFNCSNNAVNMGEFQGITYSTDIDLRDPAVTTKIVSNEHLTSKSHSVKITVSNMEGVGSKLYYTWVKSTDIVGNADEYQPTSYVGCETVNPSEVNVIGDKMDGTYYLYYKAVSAYGKEVLGHVSTPLNFDNTPINIKSISFGDVNAAVSTRDLTITVEGNATDLTSVEMYYRQVGMLGYSRKTIYTQNKVSPTTNEIASFTYDDASNTSTGTMTVSGKDLLGLSDAESMKFYFSFVTYDGASNQDEYVLDDAYLFDTSDHCNINMGISGTKYSIYDTINVSDMTVINGADHSYDNTYLASGFELTFSLQGSTSEPQVDYLYRGSENITANISNYFDSTISDVAEGSTTKKVLTLKYKSASGGNYSIRISGDGKKSEVYTFYLKGDNDNVSCYQSTAGSPLIVNKVYELKDVSYYYASSNSTAESTSYNKSKNLTLMFSSRERAYDYCYYMEMQDLSLLYVDTQSVVDVLNGTIASNYKKAEGEGTAAIGQTWIRYKSKSWDQVSDSTYWNYYFYSNSQETQINTAALSSSLRTAIITVVDKIVDKGSYTYLTSDGGLDSRGVPTLDASRIRSQSETADKTMTGYFFTSPVSFGGDSGIYSPYHVEENISYPIAVQKLTASDYTTIYYKEHVTGTTYEKLTLDGEFYLKDLIKGTGIYDIIERGEDGVREYSVYIDNTAPELKVIYDNNEITITKDFADRSQSLNVKSFTFDTLTDEDEYAYIAVFTSGEKYQGAYLVSEASGISLGEGRYIVRVYDRSGNNYSLNVRISTEDLSSACSFTNEKNKYVRFECKYSQDDIYRFEIYLDDVLIVSNVSSLKKNAITLKDAGEYRFYIEDLFGNVYEERTTLVREVPKVDWYYVKDGTPIKYDETAGTQVGFIKEKIGSTNYLITTAGQVSFRYPTGEGYAYEMVLGTSTLRHTGTYNEVVMSGDSSWQVKIYYEDYPDLFVTFTGQSDTYAPTISATTSRTKYWYADEDEDALARYLQKIKDTAKSGDVINLDDVSCELTDIVTETIASGETVNGGIVNIGVGDLSGIYKWTCTINGKTTEYLGDKVSSIQLSTEGTYQITATDLIGNQTSFSFSIGKSDFTRMIIDDVEELEFEKSSTKYGHEYAVATVEGAGTFAFVVDGEYFKLTTDGSNLIRTIYKVVIDESGELKTAEEEVDLGVLPTTYITIGETDGGYIRTYARNGIVYVGAVLKDAVQGKVNKMEIALRVSSSSAIDTKYSKIVLSDECSYLTYQKDGVDVRLTDILNINEICPLTLEAEVTTVLVNYSPISFEQAEFEDVALGGTYECGRLGEGFYVFHVYNKYGNYSETRVLYSVGIATVGEITYTDGSTKSYSTTYEGDFYSNSSVSLIVYKNVTVAVTKNGSAYKSYTVKTTDTYTQISVGGDGEYVVTLTDECGNVVTRNIHIKNKSIKYSDGWLTGFNEKALRKDEGYTNTQVSFVENTLKGASVEYITVAYGEKLTVIYDNSSETKVSFASDYKVGADGDGVYEIVFRDIYGNKVAKTVNYSSHTTLSVSRETRDLKKTAYSLDSPLVDNSIWSNKTISFETKAKKYLFKVNSETKDIPYTLSFPGTFDSGKYEYNIEYTDEYGFSYKFSCVLYRTTIEIGVDNMKVNSGVTKDPVSITFSANLSAVISINNQEIGAYKSGEKYMRDGSYVISVSDKAGNTLNYSVRRDSVADYCFYTGSVDQKLVNGEITNMSVVYFAPLNGDSVSYCAVYHDGKEMLDYDLTSFTGNGKWEVVLQDECGNKDYFSFYIVTHALVSFEYTAPYGYEITEATFNAGGGEVDYIEFVEEKDGCKYIALDENGEYKIVMMSPVTGKTTAFSVTIDKSVPTITLEGVAEGESTNKNVKISGYKAGDTIYIYKDGELVNTIEALTVSDVPEITEKGNYKIVVVNEAGGQSEVEFTRVYTANIATTVLIIGVVVAISIGLFLGLLFRKRSRIE